MYKLRSADEFAARLESIPWFENVGTKGNNSVEWVSDWKEVGKLCCEEIRWQNFKNVLVNRSGELLRSKDILDEKEFKKVDKIILDFANSKKMKEINDFLTPEQRKSRSGSGLLFHIRWDFRTIGREFLCRDFHESFFFLTDLLKWYEAGHIPCGWKGTMIKVGWSGTKRDDLPKGKMQVF